MFKWLQERKERQRQINACINDLAHHYHQLVRKYKNLYQRWNGKFICEADKIKADKLREAVRAVYKRWGDAASKHNLENHIFRHAMERSPWNT